MTKYILCQIDDYGEAQWNIEDCPADNPAEYFAKNVFYGGDSDAKPEEYNEDLTYELLGDAYIVELDKATKLDIDSVRNAHLEYWRKHNQEKTEQAERQEYERLKRKFNSK